MVRFNPCSYKRECKRCNLAGEADRPTLCIGLECDKYTPCKQCGKNLDLEGGICMYCMKKNVKANKAKAALEQTAGIKHISTDAVIDASENDISDFSIPEIPVGDGIGDIASITSPGEPLPHYPETAKQYYIRQWAEYEGYYSDPTVYYVVHQIIILEIELSIVSGTLSKFLADDDVAPKLEKRRDKLIANLASLRRQLPEKDALELSDDEKAMSMIYKRYMEEKHADTFGKSVVRRVITPDAYALAPVMHYKIDPVKLLQKLGYQIVDPEKVSKLIESPPDNPFEAAEFYGFKPREKYAMEVSKTFEEIHSEEEDFDDDDHGLVI